MNTETPRLILQRPTRQGRPTSIRVLGQRGCHVVKLSGKLELLAPIKLVVIGRTSIWFRQKSNLHWHILEGTADVPARISQDQYLGKRVRWQSTS
jgi:hypothetical protein